MEHLQQGRKLPVANSPEIAIASEVFDQFCNASTLKSILGHYRHLCELLKIRPNTINQFYPKLKAKLRSWKAQALWKKFDQRANHKCYNRGKACPNTRVLIIGGGPCGLRSAIEAQLLGAKVVVVEKRDRMSRNNVLHLWPFVIQDLRGLGAKKFFGKFCAGSIDHISIRQLQCILLKVALILGVEFHENVSFDSLIPPPENQEDGKIGWRAKTTPADHPVGQYEFDVLIGADGKRNTLEGFKRKEFRGKLAIAITANFINKRTEAEARVEEISGVAFIFNQKFFKELYQETGIDLENIVYYKDDTHYFVMTAKKHSLIDKGVILQDHADTAKLLAKENVDREALMLYAREAAEFSTEYQMMDMEFAVNHYGQPDVAMFDFTSMYAAENASRVLERHGHRLLMILVGDSLLEPFWPTGSGCARGFLSSLDACWAIKGWGGSMTPLDVIAERESIYRLLGQTTPENLNRDYAAYTLDPHTRYPNLNVSSVTPIQVRSLLDSDDPESYKATAIQSEVDIPKKRRRRDIRGESQVHPDTLLRWLQKQVALYDTVHIEDMGASFKNGLALCAIIHRYRPDLIDFHSLQSEDVIENNQLGFDVLQNELGITPIMTGEEMAQCDVPDKLAMFSYLTQIYDVFRGEIPHIRHLGVELDDEDRPEYSKQLRQLTAEQTAQLLGRVVRHDSGTRTRHSRSRHNENLLLVDKKGDTVSRRSRKRRSTEKMGATVEERQRRLAEIEKNRADRMKKRQYLRKMATQQFYKSMQMLQANAKREKDEPFEDYAIFLYRQTAPDFKDRVKYLEQKILYPDREPKIHAGHRRNSIDEEFSGRIKSIEDKLKGSAPSEKKPRDLLRAIGKIEKTDWNVKEIEKKIEENKMGRAVKHDKVERVPKWSREQFLARQIKMEKKGREQKETDSKYADIDNTLKSIDRKIKEGNVLGYNKVSAMAEQFSNKSQDAEPKVQKSGAKAAVVLPTQGGSEVCHFCNKRVYLMERLSAEGKFFHRGCFRCEYCSTSLRIGNHTFDREKNGGRFYCTQHFGLSGTMKTRVEKKRSTTVNKENIPTSSVNVKTPEKAKGGLEGVVGLDLLDRGQTLERIEFENFAGMSDAEEAQSQMDEDEWTDRNFGASTAEMGSSDDLSDMSDSDDDNEVYEEAIDQPLTTEGTLELAKNWTLRYSHPHGATGQSDTGSNEYEDSSDEYTSEEDESGTATEDEEDIRARELRKQEVGLQNPARTSDTDTGSETEVKTSQDSIDKVIEQSPDVTEPVPAPIPVLSVDKSETMTNEEVLLTKDTKTLLDPDVTKSSSFVTKSDEELKDSLTHSIEPNPSKREASESVIPKSNTLINLSSTNEDSNPIELGPSILPLNNPERDTDNPGDFVSEYESLAEDLVKESLEVIENHVAPSDESGCSYSYVVGDVTSNNLDSIKVSVPLSENSNTCIECSNTAVLVTDTEIVPEIKTQNTLVMLPDAIPCTESKYANTNVANAEGTENIDEKLPDLITSFAQYSRESSPSSSTETYNSVEIGYNALTNNSSDKTDIEPDIEKINDTQTISDRNGCRLKLDMEKMSRENCPILTVTSPSPTNEMPIEKALVEATKLTVPKEVCQQPSVPSTDTSFDKLKRDLKQRKARNKLKTGELRPLSVENAQKKISNYFSNRTKSESKSNQSKVSRIKTADEIQVVELNIKPKLSSKVEKKDIMKYFSRSGSTESKLSEDTDVNNLIHKDEDNIDVNIDELNEISENDLSIINELFNQIHKETEDVTAINENSRNKTFKDVQRQENSVITEELNTSISSVETKKVTEEITTDSSMTCPKGTEQPTKEIDVTAPSVRSHETIELTEEMSKPISIVSPRETDQPINAISMTTPVPVSMTILESQAGNALLERQKTDQIIQANIISEQKNDTSTEVAKISMHNEILKKRTGTKRNSSLYSSDGILHTERQILPEPLTPNRISKSSHDLDKPMGGIQIVKAKIIDENIPLRIGKFDHVICTDVQEREKNVPKRPDRKNVLHGISEPNSTDVKQVPLAPTRKKATKNNEVRGLIPSNISDSTPNSESLKSEKILMNQSIDSNGLIPPTKSCDNTTHAASAALENHVKCTEHNETNKSNVQDPPKPTPAKSDRSKKDKCIVASDETTEESEENLATEISTDSEFEHDGTTPTQHEIPQIRINDAFVRKTRGNYVEPKKVQIKSKVISSINGNLKQGKKVDLKNQLTKQEFDVSHTQPESASSVPKHIGTETRVPLSNPRKGDYLLNRTHSTEGIASKLSLELKKKYLLGGTALGGTVMKSGSASNVDTKLRNFTDAISQHQKLLNPAPEPSPTMQAFLQGTNKLRSSNTQISPISPTNLFTTSPVRPYLNRTTQNLESNGNPISRTSALGTEISKTHLPDIVKESSIFKSKTAPNIVCSESNKEAASTVEEQVVPSQQNEVVNNQESSKNVNSSCKTETITVNVDDNAGFRPRSPLHETSIIVPQVNWSKSNEGRKVDQASTGESEIDSDSLSSSDGELEEAAPLVKQTSVTLPPPRLQIHSTEGDILLDEAIEKCKDANDAQTFEPDSIECSYLDNELERNEDAINIDSLIVYNKPPIGIEAVKREIAGLELHDDYKSNISNCSSPSSIASAISNKQDDSEDNDVTTAALTETEFSEWARDGEVLVSDDLRDVEFNINPEFITTRRNRTLYGNKTSYNATETKGNVVSDTEVGAQKTETKWEVPNDITSKLLANGENIDFMDTDNESVLNDSLQDACNLALLKNRGYVEFVNIKASYTPTRLQNTQMNAPIAKLELGNDSCSEDELYNDRNVIEINPITMEDVKDKLYGVSNQFDFKRESSDKVKLSETRNAVEEKPLIEAVNKELYQSMEEDSLLIVEPTEDTTTSEVITILSSPVNPQLPLKEPEQTETEHLKVVADSSNPDYLEYVKRLQSRIAEFSNAKDSIDIRKSKRKNSKPSLPSRPAEVIAEEIKTQEIATNNNYNSPATSRKLEEITRERSKQKNLIQDLLMDKLEAHKQKSAEKKARRAVRASSFTSTPGLSPIKPPLPDVPSSPINKFVPISITSPASSPIHTTFSEAKKTLEIESAIKPVPPVQKEETAVKEDNVNKIQQINETTSTKMTSEAENNFKTPIAPPRLKHEEARRTAEKARQDARERARLKSDADLGLSPEDKIKELRMKVARRQLSMEERKKEEDLTIEPRLRLYSAGSTRTGLKLQTSKSTDNMKAIAEAMKFGGLSSTSAKSMDELLHSSTSPKISYSTPVVKREKKKTKDPERRKSIIQAVSDFFFKKETSPSPSNQKDKLSMFRLSSKSKGKLDKIISPKLNTRPKSVCEGMLSQNFFNESAPPIPPPPLNYTLSTTQVSDDSLSDDETRTAAVSTSCTQKLNTTDGSCNSISRKSKTTKRVARQARLKRLRMAQEIQRKLEETEVKQRELESRGVSVEKALRGEGECSDREEADLLREWFDLMKERTELRRYEKELLVRAQEVQLEDRHERLQQELRERLADDDEKKTSADVKKEGEILTEMLEIVARRDSLIALLEEERQRYQDEDRDLEAQMLAKGLRLTPIKKCGPKYTN